MSKAQQTSLLCLRLVMGWMFFYAGFTKVIKPEWSAEGYLKGAKLFAGFYNWLTEPGILPIINFVNAWGLTLLGISLILGLFVRLSSSLGAILMLLYYLPLGFPYPNSHALIVDEHIIYLFTLTFLGFIRAGRYFGLDGLYGAWPMAERWPKLRNWLG